ncbi:hypothetical protein EXE10_18260 [Acinetobacter sp. WCHAc060033]|uniref:hypothetical protein n=1 Tax=Acinetobacter sp. WCHAc060033 TaxID=2518624 RepID=UPI001023AFEC|nr:hypothetical protein [Acinetobacter sp. WCHAc060033]RZG78364.1 hypothetical protein EXE10_18260 [Acinetobacter sp. WCHAc060033]
MSGNELWVTILKLASDSLSALQYWIAGLIGAAVTARYNKEQLKTPYDYMIFLLSGAFTAHYLTSLIMYYAKLEPIHTGGIGFLTGALGGLVFQELFVWIKTGAYKHISFKQFFIDMIKNWKNGGKS